MQDKDGTDDRELIKMWKQNYGEHSISTSVRAQTVRSGYHVLGNGFQQYQRIIETVKKFKFLYYVHKLVIHKTSQPSTRIEKYYLP